MQHAPMDWDDVHFRNHQGVRTLETSLQLEAEHLLRFLFSRFAGKCSRVSMIGEPQCEVLPLPGERVLFSLMLTSESHKLDLVIREQDLRESDDTQLRVDRFDRMNAAWALHERPTGAWELTDTGLIPTDVGRAPRGRIDPRT